MRPRVKRERAVVVGKNRTRSTERKLVMMPGPAICTPKSLSADKLVQAARMAVDINPANHAPLERLMGAMPGFAPSLEYIAVVTSKFWHTKGVRLTVGFLDN